MTYGTNSVLQVGGVLCLVVNSQLFYDASACLHLKEAQEAWMEEQLSRASSTVMTSFYFQMMLLDNDSVYLLSLDIGVWVLESYDTTTEFCL